MSAVAIQLSSNQARALHWLVRHLSFEDALQSVPPHLGKELRTERAYQIIHAAAALEAALETVDHYGDSWMYAEA